MNDLVINVSWEFFLGLTGTIIALAYYANGRFTRLETNVDWLTEAVRDLVIRADNISAKLYENGSPLALTSTGLRFLKDSGLKMYIDDRKDEFVAALHISAPFDLHRVQQRAFRVLAHTRFSECFAQDLDRFAFRNGVSRDLLRRIGAIYLRDIAVATN